MHENVEENIYTLVSGLAHRLLIDSRGGAIDAELLRKLKDDTTKNLLAVLTNQKDHNFVAYVDRLVEGLSINVNIGIRVLGGEDSPEWEAAGHAIGLLRSEVEGTISHIGMMESFRRRGEIKR